MSYYYDKSVSNVCVKTDVAFYSENVKVKEILMPESLDSDRINFSSAGMVSLAEYLSYTTEKEILYFIYYLLKASSEWNEKTSDELNLIIDSDVIFYNRKKNLFCFAAERKAEDINLIEFIKKTVFGAVYKEKDLQTVVELIGFIRASIHTTSRDVLLFIEMSKYGRSFMSDWSKIKKSFDGSQSRNESHTGSLKPKNKAINSVNNSTDFSSFLSVEDLYSDSDTHQDGSAVEVSERHFEKEEEPCNVSIAQMTGRENNRSVLSDKSTIIEDEKREKEEIEDLFSKANTFQDESLLSTSHEHKDEKMFDQLSDNIFGDINSYYEPEQGYDNVVEQKEEAQPPIANMFQDESLLTTSHEHKDEKIFDQLSDNIFGDKNSYYEPEQGYDNMVAPQKEAPYPLEYKSVSDTEPDNIDMTIVLQERELYTEVKKAFLTDVSGNEVPVNKDYFVIGRNSKESDFSVRDSSISRRHVAIISTDASFYIEDLGSLNKTFLNGKQLIPNQREQLSDGDVILVSRSEFKFSIQTFMEKC